MSLQKASSNSCSVTLVVFEAREVRRLCSTASLGVWVRFVGISCSKFFGANKAVKSSSLRLEGALNYFTFLRAIPFTHPSDKLFKSKKFY